MVTRAASCATAGAAPPGTAHCSSAARTLAMPPPGPPLRASSMANPCSRSHVDVGHTVGSGAVRIGCADDSTSFRISADASEEDQGKPTPLSPLLPAALLPPAAPASTGASASVSAPASASCKRATSAAGERTSASSASACRPHSTNKRAAPG
eukprot:73513-Chlamydomonas_euryale.AAC.2